MQVCENHDADKVAEVERMVNEGSINLYHLAGGGAAELADTTRWRAPGEIAQRGMRRKAGGAADAAAAAAVTRTHTHTHPFNGPLSGTTLVSRYQKGEISLDLTEARDSEWQWHRPGHMQVCTSLQTDNHASTPPLKFLQAGWPSCRPTNSVNALKAQTAPR